MSLASAISRNHSDFFAIGLSRQRGTAVASPSFVPTKTRRQIAIMVGEFLREAGVLIAVLAPLELLVTLGGLTAKSVLVIVVSAAPCLVAGIMLGLER
jgi:hypothetical protein